MTYKLIIRKDDEVGKWELAVFDSENIEDKSYDDCMDVFFELMFMHNVKGKRLKIIDNSKDISEMNEGS